ncbi:hypothetical protein [Streptomyces mutomycini]|uniref:Uncharacterized protein n=1 Tax=Streptomyces mutomycini TaxID=284036 RepID=A0ABW0B3H4_9ACTN
MESLRVRCRLVADVWVHTPRNDPGPPEADQVPAGSRAAATSSM